MGKVRTLADELPSLVEVELWLPEARQTLAQLRSRGRSILTSVALANNADPATGEAANLIAAHEASCDALARQLDNAATLALVVRQYVETRPADDPSFAIPADVRNAWGKMTFSKICAVDDLKQIDQLLR